MVPSPGAGLGLALGLWLAAGCGSVAEPKDAGPQPVREPLPPSTTRQPESKASPAPPDHGVGVDVFARSVVAAWRRNPGAIAVLPAFSDDPLHPRGTQVFASGAGDWLAARVLSALAAAEPALEVWAPETVVAELLRSNRSLRDVRTTQDVIPLLALTDAAYAVYGNVDQETVGGRLSGQSSIRVRLLCADLRSGEVVGSCESTLVEANAVRELAARAERASVVLVGARAPDFTPSLDAEVARSAERGLAKLIDAHRGLLAGKRCAVNVESPAAESGRALAATVRSTLLARLARALPGKDAISVVDTASAAGDVLLAAAFERGADRYALALALRRPGERDGVRVSVPIDARFHAELRRAVP